MIADYAKDNGLGSVVIFYVYDHKPLQHYYLCVGRYKADLFFFPPLNRPWEPLHLIVTDMVYHLVI